MKAKSRSSYLPPDRAQKLLVRLGLVEGKVNTIGRMMHDDRPVSEVLRQIVSVRSAVNEIGHLLWAEYLAQIAVSGQENGAEELTRALERLGRHR